MEDRFVMHDRLSSVIPANEARSWLIVFGLAALFLPGAREASSVW